MKYYYNILFAFLVLLFHIILKHILLYLNISTIFEDGLSITRNILLGLLILYKSNKIHPKYLFNNKITSYYTSALLLVLTLGIVTEELVRVGKNVLSFYNITLLIKCFSVALFEEILFRYYLFINLFQLLENRKHRFLKSFLLTNSIFALAHLNNIWDPSYISLSVIAQVYLAFYLGILLQSVLIRIKNVLPIITIHALINYLGSYKIYLIVEPDSILSKLPEDDLMYTSTNLLLNVIIITVLAIIIILPICYLLLPKKIWKENEW